MSGVGVVGKAEISNSIDKDYFYDYSVYDYSVYVRMLLARIDGAGVAYTSTSS